MRRVKQYHSGRVRGPGGCTTEGYAGSGMSELISSQDDSVSRKPSKHCHDYHVHRKVVVSA